MNRSLVFSAFQRMAIILVLWGLFFETGRASARPVGIDSDFHCCSANWSQIAGSGVQFACIKATWAPCAANNYTWWTNDVFANRMNGAQAAGIYTIPYHRCNPSLDSPEMEAQYFWNWAGSSIIAGGTHSLSPALDLEDGLGQGVVGAVSLSDWCNKWYAAVSNYAGRVGVTLKQMAYVNVGSSCYLNSGIHGFGWVANPYNGEDPQTGSPWDCPCNNHSECQVWGSGVWSIWQYKWSSQESSPPFPGLSERVDINVYNGTLAGMISTLGVGFHPTANELYWVGANSAFWTNAANWLSNSSPASASDVIFSYLTRNTGSAYASQLGANYSVDGLVFLCTGGALSINDASTPSHTLTLGAGGIDATAANQNISLNTPIHVAANQTWTVGPNIPGNALTVNGALSGTATVTKAGSGAVVLNGTNSFSGTLNADTGSSTADDGALTIGNSAAVADVASIAIRNTGWAVSSLQLANGVTVPCSVSLAGRSSTVPGIASVSGVNNSLAGGITLTGGGTSYVVQSALGSLSIGGIVSAGGTATGARTLTFQGNGGFSIPASIQNGSASALGVVKTNSGTLTFSGANTYTGLTTAAKGSLCVNGSLAGPLLFNPGSGYFYGTGTVDGAATVQSGILSPGNTSVNSIGTLTFGGNLTLTGGTTLMEINPTTQTNDRLNVAGVLNYGGALYVSNMGGAPCPGQSFKLFNAAACNGGFNPVTLPPLNPGLVWDTSGLTNGVISVVAIPVTLVNTNLGNGQLQLIWTYGTLQSATNAQGPYIDVPGGTPPYTVTPTNPQQFYRAHESFAH